MKPTQAATLAARIVGLLTLVWVYLASTDLRWLLHLHAVHLRVTHTPFAFSYNIYLACTIGNLAAAIAVAGVLLLLPSCLLRALAPIAKSARALSAGWFASGIAIGLVLLVLSLNAILATTLWTIYRAGQNPGWQVDLFVYGLVAVGGVVLCRGILARRQEE